MAKRPKAGIAVTVGHKNKKSGVASRVTKYGVEAPPAGMVVTVGHKKPGVASRATKRAVEAAPGFMCNVLAHASPFVAIHGLSVMERAVIVEYGLPARFLGRLAGELAVSKETLYDIIGVSRATADRKLKADHVLSAADSEHAMGLARLVGQVEQMVQESGNPDGFDAGRWVAAFLDAPSPALGDRRPRDLMRTSDGRTVVSTLVAQMQSGAYA